MTPRQLRERQPDWLSAKSVARRYDIEKNYVYQLVREGFIPPGRKVAGIYGLRWSLEELRSRDWNRTRDEPEYQI
jgi:hypothetical protein